TRRSSDLQVHRCRSPQLLGVEAGWPAVAAVPAAAGGGALAVPVDLVPAAEHVDLEAVAGAAAVDHASFAVGEDLASGEPLSGHAPIIHACALIVNAPVVHGPGPGPDPEGPSRPTGWSPRGGTTGGTTGPGPPGGDPHKGPQDRTPAVSGVRSRGVRSRGVSAVPGFRRIPVGPRDRQNRGQDLFH